MGYQALTEAGANASQRVQMRSVSGAALASEDKTNVGFKLQMIIYHAFCASLVGVAVTRDWLSVEGGGMAWELWAVWQQVCLWTLFVENLVRCVCFPAEALWTSTFKVVCLYTVPLVSEVTDTMKDWVMTGVCVLASTPSHAGFVVGAVMTLGDVLLAYKAHNLGAGILITGAIGRICPLVVAMQGALVTGITLMYGSQLLALVASLLAAAGALVLFFLLGFVGSLLCSILSGLRIIPWEDVVKFGGFLHWLLAKIQALPAIVWATRGFGAFLVQRWILSVTDAGCLAVVSCYTIVYSYWLVTYFPETCNELKRSYRPIISLKQTVPPPLEDEGFFGWLCSKCSSMLAGFCVDFLSSARLLIAVGEDWPQGFLGVIITYRYGHGLGFAGVSAVWSLLKGILIASGQFLIFSNRSSAASRAISIMPEIFASRLFSFHQRKPKHLSEVEWYLDHMIVIGEEVGDEVFAGLHLRRGVELFASLFERLDDYLARIKSSGDDGRTFKDEAIVSLLRFYKEHGTLIKEIKELGFSRQSYLQVYVMLDFMKEGLVRTPADAQKEGFTISQDIEQSVRAQDRFTREDLQKHECTLEEIYEAGLVLTIKDCCEAGFALKDILGLYTGTKHWCPSFLACLPGKLTCCWYPRLLSVEAVLNQCKQAGYHFSAKEYRQAGLSVKHYNKAGFSVKDCYDNGHSLEQCRQLGGYSAKDFKAAGLSVKDCGQAGFSLEDLLEAGFSEEAHIIVKSDLTASMCHQRGVPMSCCREVGFSLRECREAGYPPGDCKAADYSASEFQEAGFSVKACVEAGFSLQQAQQGGFSLKACIEAGYSPRDCKAAGYSAIHFQRAGLSVRDCERAGFSLQEVQQSGFPLKACTDQGFSVEQCRQAGYSATDCKNAGLSPKDCQEAGFSLLDCSEAGFSVKDCYDNGHSLEQCRQLGGYSAQDFKDAGLSVKDCGQAGFSLQDIQQGGFDLRAVYDKSHHHHEYSLEQCRQAGYSASGFRTAGFLARDCEAAGFSLPAIRSAGYTLKDCREQGLSLVECLDAGFPASHFRVAGWTAKDFFESNHSMTDCMRAGYSLRECRDCGYSLKDCRQHQIAVSDFKQTHLSVKDCMCAGFSESEIIDGGFSKWAYEIVRQGWTATECKQRGMHITFLQEAELAVDECIKAGYSARHCRAAGYSAIDFQRAGLSIQECEYAGFSLPDCKVAGYTARDFLKSDKSVKDCVQAGFSLLDCEGAGYEEWAFVFYRRAYESR
ncbi:dotG [Symbiodinium sp. CCMP2456]|nr:dotG [Symbiodinium sp. CCMP2456]